MHPFVKTDILLPQVESMEKWAVIACDQFVSQPDYWEAVKKNTADVPSAFHLILPEAELEHDCSEAIAMIHKTMEKYLENAVFRQQSDCFVYVERTLLNGSIRKGVIGAVDLEQYDFTPGSCSAIRATEQTVAERVPPRIEIRRDAVLELPHVLLLCDDDKRLLIESLTAKKDTLPLLYDFELMAGGGKIRGYLVAGNDAQAFSRQLEAYEQRMTAKYGVKALLYAVGDGNHSLAAAKGCYEECKKQGLSCEKTRYALVELENIHDDAQVFEPIHRIVKNTQPDALLAAMEQAIGKEEGFPVQWHIGSRQGVIYVRDEAGTLPVGIVQDFLDDYLKVNDGITDYIHGEDATCRLSSSEGTIGLILPPVEKDAFFQGILAGGTLPRKTFSMGHAQEKRYYLEARKIK